MLRNLLIYRLLVFNFVMLGLVTLLGARGYVAPVFTQDSSYVTFAVVGLFLCVLVSAVIRAFKISQAINLWKTTGADIRPIVARRVHLAASKLSHKIAHIGKAAGWMAMLGLIGTVVGFAIAFGGVDQGALSTAEGTQGMMSQLAGGVGIALNTTLVGAVAALWTEVNYLMLRTTSMCLLRDIESASRE